MKMKITLDLDLVDYEEINYVTKETVTTAITKEISRKIKDSKEFQRLTDKISDEAIKNIIRQQKKMKQHQDKIKKEK